MIMIVHVFINSIEKNLKIGSICREIQKNHWKIREAKDVTLMTEESMRRM